MSDLVYYIASTLDGFIAHEDGSFDGFDWDDEVYSAFISDQANFETVLMGRKTYDVGVAEGITSPYPKMRQIVFSKRMQASLDPDVELISGNLIENVRRIKAETNQPIWLCGGSEIATPLFAAGLIEKVVVKLNPVMFGSGIPILGEIAGNVALVLDEITPYACGIIFLKYSVKSNVS